MRRTFNKFFFFVVVVMILAFAYNAFIFIDCMADGKRAYQCNAAISNPHYVGFDDFNE